MRFVQVMLGIAIVIVIRGRVLRVIRTRAMQGLRLIGAGFVAILVSISEVAATSFAATDVVLRFRGLPVFRSEPSLGGPIRIRGVTR